ncbi:MAG: hypothetical protein JNN03_23790 [Rubrivivax sp.]|nr:hypothetical protein [Rubrivivax sp.]
MTTNFFRRSSTSALIALAGAAMVLAGCAAQDSTAPVSVEPKIANASNRVDHEDLASWYEGQAAVNAAAAKRHQGYAATYRKNTSPSAGPDVHLALALHCENLARTYQQAADQNLALAKVHRELAAQAK